MVKVRSHELRQLPKDELLKKVDEMKMELSALRVAQVTGGPASKLAKIKTVRRSVAKVLTVLNQNQKAALRKVYAGKKFVPRDIRVKKTRAMRRALKPEELAAKTLRQQKRDAAFPQRKFALAL
eukprot:TRINITY_DN1681_c0_g1_i2.p3 TRINITY_DN1681_c0_g1~~TRINITY_DN1681_c0_g1_i2.p3  ORF type:complete len:124 (+),score=60.54 TRINITY_DN1681_c0_g1_i2:106-477(+)